MKIYQDRLFIVTVYKDFTCSEIVLKPCQAQSWVCMCYCFIHRMLCSIENYIAYLAGNICLITIIISPTKFVHHLRVLNFTQLQNKKWL